MFGSNFRDFVSQDTTSQGQSNSERLIKSWHGFEKPDSEDSGIEEEFEVLDSESQEIPATPCSTPPEDLSLENAILANFPDGCDRSFTVELKDEDSYGIIPKNLTFAEIINILNQAIQEDNCEELDKVVQNIENYEGRSITLDNENLKDFCSNQLNLELQNRSNHQHIYSNVLSQYKFDQVEFKYDYSVKELVLLAIAANDKLVEQYQDFLFAEENLSLLPLLVGGQKYIEAFIEKFHGTDGVYGRLKGQAIQLVEPNKIDFFSATALRKEQELLNAVFVEYVLRDFGQVLKTSKPDPLYGVLETASLIKNEEFITIVLDAFERYINEPTKKASTEELLKKSFATLLETAISQEHISVIEYLCKRYTNSADHAIYDVYKQAFTDDKVITILRQQILKNIGARGRKEIYDLILKTALDAGNVTFIEHLCKECAKCSNDVINYLDHKLKNNEFDEIYESILVALSNTGSQDIIVSVLARVQICQSILNNKQQVFRQTIQNILRNAIKEASYEVVVLLCQHVDLKFAALQAICKEEFEKALPVVAEQLEKTSMELFPSMTRNEYQKNRDTLNNLYLISNLLKSSKLINTSSKANIQTQTDTQVNKGSSNNAVSPVINVEGVSTVINELPVLSQVVNEKSDDQSENPGLESAGSKQTEKNIVDNEKDIINSGEASIEEAIGNDYRRGKMFKRSKKKDVKELASPVKKKIDEIISKGNDNLEEEFKDVLKNANHDLVLKYAKNQEGPFRGEVVEFLTQYIKNKKNGAQTNGGQPSNLSNTVPPVQPTTPETPNASSSENSFQLEGDQDTQPLLLQSSVSGDEHSGTPSNPSSEYVVIPSGSGSSSPIQDIVNEEEPVVITTRQPNDGEHDKTVSKEHQDDALKKDLIDFSSDDGNSLLGDPVPTLTNEIPEQEDGTQTTTRQQEPNPIPTPTPAPTPNLTPTPNPIPTPTPAPGLTPDLTQDPILTPTLVPTPNLTPTPNPVPTPEPVPPVADGSSGQVGDTQTNGKLPNNPGNGSITATQNTQKSKWPTVAIWTFAVAGILAGAAAPAAYFAFSVSLLTTGIIAGVGVCCLVAALIIYCCNRPSSSFKGSNVELIADKELAATVS
ncbi:host RNA manipulator TomO [Wolbachia endosymbiont (group A) of Barypeithes pellucidus]|uniref:host RNA manipulator TomO n=1 Tax=Wolbachia endosymbiont (group A) of Barypeithes pellucidus TaxID=3139322 RepID=UPI003CCAD7AC